MKSIVLFILFIFVQVVSPMPPLLVSFDGIMSFPSSEIVEGPSVSPVGRRRRSSTTTSRIKMLMKLLEAAKLQDCAGRVVCDLNCDASRYGSSGKKVLDMMTRFKGSSVMGLREMQMLVTAGLAGRMYYWTSHCGRCREGYPHCFTDSDELIEVASIFDFDLPKEPPAPPPGKGKKTPSTSPSSP